MWLRYIFFSIFLVGSYPGYTQFNEKFDDNELLANPLWKGNTDHFIVNSAGQLQLNATVAGESYIFSAYNLLKDSLEIDLYFKMTFDPSENNVSYIYIAADNENRLESNSYYLKLGENGTNDNIQLYRYENGMPTLLGSGAISAISKDPAQAKLKIRITREGMWLFETNYAGGNVLVSEFELMDDEIFNFPSQVYFGIYCKYTSTRLKNFFFDDISVKKWERDTVPPQLVSTKVLDENHVELTFSERMNPVSSLRTDIYNVNSNLGNPTVVEFGAEENKIILEFSQKILSGIEYVLNITGVSDYSNNLLNTQASFFFAVEPDKSDLIINEILTDPFVGGEDFIELYNRSQKFIQVKNLIIRNESKGEEKIINQDKILRPGEYISISKNIDFLKTQYVTPENASFIQNELPTLNVSDAHIKLLINNGQEIILIDEFEYKEEYHFNLLNNTKGVSLERIQLTGESNNPDVWHSASQASGFATPGYKNSNLISGGDAENEEITLLNKSFSPYAQGFDPFLLIGYKFKKNGFLVSIKIFDIEGFPVKTLTQNLLLGTEGVIKWDGLNDENSIVKMGWYIVATELFHPDGETRHFKQTVVVGDKL
ncbi:MAG: lamin tail domain-containing protein [Saprospiraceae bacterium]|nr:lamin tail domain-containing protein [Saprospiraceae bacterium]